MSEKTFFGCIDMRNAKFQGSIRNNAPDGLGIALNQDFLLALTNWKNEEPYGPSVIIFPSRNYLFGSIKNKKLQGICSYVTVEGEVFYFSFVNGVADKIAFLEMNGLITEVIVSEGKYKSGASYSLKQKQNNKWDIISKIISAQVKTEMKNVRFFIRDVIEKEFYDIIESSESSGLLFVGFKNTASLGFKIDREDKVRQVGNFQPFPRNLQFGRKHTDNISKTYKTEEGKFTSPQKIFTYERAQPADAAKYTEQFFKRGTNFRNGFFKFGCIGEIETYLKGVERQVQHLSILQYGQKIIEGEKEHEEEELYRNKVYTMEEVKKDIYAAVTRRNNGRKTEHISPERVKEERVLTPYNEFKQISNNHDLSSGRKSNQKRYIYTEDAKNVLNRQSPQSHSKTNLNEFTLYQHSDRKPKREVYYQSPVVEKIDIPGRTNSRERLHLRANENSYRLFTLEEEVILRRHRDEVLLGLTLNEPRLSISPIKPIFKVSHQPKIYIPQPRDKSANKTSYEEYEKTKQDPEYPNYSKYKNRNKTPIKNMGMFPENRESGSKSMAIPKKYDIYERKTAAKNVNDSDPQNNSGEKDIEKKERISTYQPMLLGNRHKKNFKYL